MTGEHAAIGFRARTGRAIAVALHGSRDEPVLLLRREVSLVDDRIPETAQPYHEVMELAWDESLRRVVPFVSAIEAVAVSVLTDLAAELRRRGCEIGAIGIVGSADRPLEKIGNPHIRAHAAEGILFRRVLEVGAKTMRIESHTLAEKTLSDSTPRDLGLTPQRIAAQLKRLGETAGAPWRADEKAAAVAAWISLRRTQSR